MGLTEKTHRKKSPLSKYMQSSTAVLTCALSGGSDGHDRVLLNEVDLVTGQEPENLLLRHVSIEHRHRLEIVLGLPLEGGLQRLQEGSLLFHGVHSDDENASRDRYILCLDLSSRVMGATVQYGLGLGGRRCLRRRVQGFHCARGGEYGEEHGKQS